MPYISEESCNHGNTFLWGGDRYAASENPGRAAGENLGESGAAKKLSKAAESYHISYLIC